MLLTPTHLAKGYDVYQGLPAPGRALHGALDAHAVHARAQAAAARSTQARREHRGGEGVAQGAHAYGLYVGSAVSFVLKPLDLLAGTGGNASGLEAPLATAGLRPALAAAAKRPCETGLAGLVVGLHAAACAAVGAVAGACIGVTFGAVYAALARDPARAYRAQLEGVVAGCAANGAAVGGALCALWSGLPGTVLLISALRSVTALVRGVLVSASYVVGATVGLVATGVAVGFATPQPPPLPAT